MYMTSYIFWKNYERMESSIIYVDVFRVRKIDGSRVEDGIFFLHGDRWCRFVCGVCVKLVCIYCCISCEFWLVTCWVKLSSLRRWTPSMKPFFYLLRTCGFGVHPHVDVVLVEQVAVHRNIAALLPVHQPHKLFELFLHRCASFMTSWPHFSSCCRVCTHNKHLYHQCYYLLIKLNHVIYNWWDTNSDQATPSHEARQCEDFDGGVRNLSVADRKSVV